MIGVDEFILVMYKGVSRLLWNMCYDVYVFIYVFDGLVKNVFFGSFDNSYSVARVYDLGCIFLGCRDDEEFNFLVMYYMDDL